MLDIFRSKLKPLIHYSDDQRRQWSHIESTSARNKFYSRKSEKSKICVTSVSVNWPATWSTTIVLKISSLSKCLTFLNICWQWLKSLRPVAIIVAVVYPPTCDDWFFFGNGRFFFFHQFWTRVYNFFDWFLWIWVSWKNMWAGWWSNLQHRGTRR